MLGLSGVKNTVTSSLMSQSDTSHIENAFPNLLTSGYVVTSPDLPDYNCVAWAANDQTRWWQPPSHIGGTFWPSKAPQEETLRSWIGMFRLEGYATCDLEKYEVGFEKIAIFSDADDLPTHVARQLVLGKWTSKLGEWEDIEHNDLAGLEGDLYGTVAVIMKRPIASQPNLPNIQ
jgi:hypothetical protein